MYKINPRFAQQIVCEMKTILNEEINFMDPNGTIIASTDESRCGNFHEAAKLCVDRDRSIIVMSDDEYRGALKGANMPIRYEGDVVGVIGITGDITDIGKHTEILQRMTEILIRESFVSDILSVRYENYRLAIAELLEGTKEDGRSILPILGIDPMLPRTVVSLILEHDLANIGNVQRINRVLLNTFMNDKQSLFAPNINGYVLFISHENRNALVALLDQINQDAPSSFKCYAGISEPVRDGQGYKEALFSAEIASMHAKDQDKGRVFASDLKMPLILYSVPKNIKDTFVERILGSLSKEEVEYYAKVIEAFAHHNGSISRAAEDLFIHKNTLQYQLNKLKELIGLDMRNFDEFTIIRLAFQFHDLCG